MGKHAARPDWEYDTLFDRHSAADFGVGICKISNPEYSIFCISDSEEWMSYGKSALLSSRPSAALLGKGQWQIGSTIYISNGSKWLELDQTINNLPATEFYKEVMNSAVTPAWAFSGTAIDAASSSVLKSSIAGLAESGYPTDGYALRLKTTGAGTCRAQRQPVSIPGVVSATSVFILAIWCPTALSGGDDIQYIGYDGALSPKITYQQSSWRSGLNYIVLDAAAATSGPMAGTMTYDRLQLTTAAGAGEIYVLDFYHYIKPAIEKKFNIATQKLESQFKKKAQSKIMIEFDDAFSSLYTTAFPLMEALGIRGSIAVIRDVVGKTAAGSFTSPFGVTINDVHTYCTEAQLLEMQAAGWELIVHGYYNHISAPLSDDYASILADVAKNQAYVKALGGNYKSYVYPGGQVTDNSVAALKYLGFVSGRKTAEGSDYLVGIIGDEQPFKSKSFALNQTFGVAAAQAALTRAIKSCSTCRFYAHRVLAAVTDANNEITTTDFTTFINSVSGYMTSLSLINAIPSEYESDFGLR